MVDDELANDLHQVVNNTSDHESVFSDDEFKKIFWDQQMCNKNNNKFIPFMQYLLLYFYNHVIGCSM